MMTAKRWSYSAGERGRNRVRAFAHARTDRIFVEVYEPTRRGERPKAKRIALGHRDRERAKATAEQLAAELRRGTPPEHEQVTLGKLFDIYDREVTPTKGRGTQQHDRATAQLFLRAFGADRKPLTLGLRDWQRFISQRRSGRLAPKGPKGHTKAKKVGERQLTYDLKFLTSVFRWATLAGDGAGGVLLEKNPCAGFPYPSEATPRRPRMPESRYRAMLAVAQTVDPDFRLALVLAHETGHRLSSIRQLWWSDVRWDERLIRWRGETDKEGSEHTTPLTADAFDALTQARARSAAIGDRWIFPEVRQRGEDQQPRSRHTFQKWWTQAEDAAELTHVSRMGWHSLRRQFVTDLKTVPLKDLCALGGWKNPQTVLTCYMQSDEDTMRSALDGRKSVRVSGEK